MQLHSEGQNCIIAYARHKWQKHKCNYTSFLLEMQAAIWGMEHFATYPHGCLLTLITDHWPLKNVGKVHTMTQNHLQEIMNTFDFDIIYHHFTSVHPTTTNGTWPVSPCRHFWPIANPIKARNSFCVWQMPLPRTSNWLSYQIIRPLQ